MGLVISLDLVGYNVTVDLLNVELCIRSENAAQRDT